MRKLSKDSMQLVTAYKNGWTLRKLAAFYKVSPGTIRNELLLEGVDLRTRGRRKNVVEVTKHENV